MNKAQIIGNLGADSELRYTTSGAAALNFRVASNETFTDQNGEKQKVTDWHRVVLFGKPAESLAQYLKKGKQVAVEGKMETRSWTDKEGINRFSTQVVIRPGRGSIELLGGPRNQEEAE